MQINMKSGWIIKFKDGYTVALSEEKYVDWSKENKKLHVSIEEHWFDIYKGMEENGLKRLEI